MAAGGDGESSLQCPDTFPDGRKKSAATRTVAMGGGVHSNPGDGTTAT